MSTTNGHTYDFFISYAEDARAWVNGYLIPKLKRDEKRFFLEENFQLGRPWLIEAEQAISLSHKVIFILTPQHVSNHFGQFVQVMTQTKGAEEQAWPLLPVMLKPVNRTLLLRTLGVVDLTNDEDHEAAISKLLLALEVNDQEHINKKEEKSPYPGMKPFQETDAEYFFGREKEVNEFLLRLRQDRILALIGSSGCGKSSIVRAGIIPKLNEYYLGNSCQVYSMRPSDELFENFIKAYADDIAACTDKFLDLLFIKNTNDDYLILFIDQFEEIFSFKDQRHADHLSQHAIIFLKLLGQLLKKENIFIILTIRDEFYPQLAWCSEFLNIDNYLQRVGMLSRKGLMDAIRKPAEKVGIWFDEILIERLVNDAGDDPGILPFVQATLDILWEQKDESYINLKHYEDLEVNGVSGLKYAIAIKADSAINALPTPQHKDIARQIFIRLVQFGENGRPDTRLRQPISKLHSCATDLRLLNETLTQLATDDSRLLIISNEDRSEAKVDIVHESLIVSWPMLQGWLGELKAFEEKRRYFLDKALEWDKSHGRNFGFLDKEQLKSAKVWLSRNDGFSGLADNVVHEHINASILYLRRQLLQKLAFPILALILIGTYFIYLEIYHLYLKNSILKINELVFIEAGWYTIGSNKNKNASHYPELKIRLTNFGIERYEVSNEFYCKCLKAGVCSSIDYHGTNVCNANKDEPVSNIKAYEAQEYCEWLGRRLPTEYEWEAAARTKKRYKYPSINGKEPRHANFGTNKKESIYSQDISKLQIYGLAGNVYEWTSSKHISYCSDDEDKYQKTKKSIMVIKGGAADSILKSSITFSRGSIPEDLDDNFIGFRCVSGKPSNTLISKEICNET